MPECVVCWQIVGFLAVVGVCSMVFVLIGGRT